MADIPALMADIPAPMADIPALMADLDARRWADLLSQIPQSPIQNPGEYGDSGPSSSTQRDFLRGRLGGTHRECRLEVRSMLLVWSAFREF